MALSPLLSDCASSAGYPGHGGNDRTMQSRRGIYLLLGVLWLVLPARAGVRDGQHDFDFNVGSWKTDIRRLGHPLTGSTSWVHWHGTVSVRKVWHGRAQLEEVEVDGGGSHVEGLTLRLYNPQAHQWSLSWANSEEGTLGAAAVGEFRNGRGGFFDQESFQGRAIF